MKTFRSHPRRCGFTLVELLIAMLITTIIASVLISVTAVAIDSWNRSRAELRAARQAKFMVDTIAKDFESLVTRRGNKFEWLSAKTDTTLPGPDRQKSSNASKLIFFTAATPVTTSSGNNNNMPRVRFNMLFNSAIIGRYCTKNDSATATMKQACTSQRHTHTHTSPHAPPTPS